MITRNRFAKFTPRKRGERNKTEAAYELHLDLLKRAGVIIDYRFEGVKLRLADNTFYTPDFIVFDRDGVVELHDTKGGKKVTRTNGDRVSVPWCEEDAKIKMKVVAELYPFRVFVVWKNGTAWEKQQF